MINTTTQLGADLAGKRIDQAAAILFPDFSRARLQSWIRDGSLTVDGNSVMPKHRVSGGELIRLKAELVLDDEVIAQDIPLDIVAEDEHILVINKPAGLVVHPAAGHPDGTLQNGLLHFDPELAGIPRSGIVHRLDKDTSGVMVVARSLKAHHSLVSQLQERSMSRIYRAVAHGITPVKGTVNAPIGRNPRDRQSMAVVGSGKPAVSHYRRLQAFEHFSYISVSLESGRTHQIRVHMRHLGFPLVGDPSYGQKIPSNSKISQKLRQVIETFPRQALHAHTLKLLHPETGEERKFRAGVPEDISELLDELASYDPG